ncbi:MAG: transposase [Candidatus Poribacteria bacterium]|nr:transposase [Candidatus Poribacteria bacterium]MDE0504762.1 transposase [Candidatus Poribacteria bacterium]
MRLSTIGQIATDCWQDIPEHFENTALDEFVVMPNHIHGIIILIRDADLRPLQQLTHDRSEMYLSKIIHAFKSPVSRIIKRRRNDHVYAWQRSFYDHVIRTGESLDDIRAYIKNNPPN